MICATWRSLESFSSSRAILSIRHHLQHHPRERECGDRQTFPNISTLCNSTYRRGFRTDVTGHFPGQCLVKGNGRRTRSDPYVGTNNAPVADPDCCVFSTRETGSCAGHYEYERTAPGCVGTTPGCALNPAACFGTVCHNEGEKNELNRLVGEAKVLQDELAEIDAQPCWEESTGQPRGPALASGDILSGYAPEEGVEDRVNSSYDFPPCARPCASDAERYDPHNQVVLPYSGTVGNCPSGRPVVRVLARALVLRKRAGLEQHLGRAHLQKHHSLTTVHHSLPLTFFEQFNIDGKSARGPAYDCPAPPVFTYRWEPTTCADRPTKAECTNQRSECFRLLGNTGRYYHDEVCPTGIVDIDGVFDTRHGIDPCRGRGEVIWSDPIVTESSREFNVYETKVFSEERVWDVERLHLDGLDREEGLVNLTKVRAGLRKTYKHRRTVVTGTKTLTWTNTTYTAKCDRDVYLELHFNESCYLGPKGAGNAHAYKRLVLRGGSELRTCHDGTCRPLEVKELVVEEGGRISGDHFGDVPGMVTSQPWSSPDEKAKGGQYASQKGTPEGKPDAKYSMYAPLAPGAGGFRPDGDNSNAAACGGEGGGVVDIIVDDTFHLLGEVSASGRAHGANSICHSDSVLQGHGIGCDWRRTCSSTALGGGGGSGGSVRIQADRLSGVGIINANGGDGTHGGHGGSGGRVAVLAPNFDFKGTMNAFGGGGETIGDTGTAYASYVETYLDQASGDYRKRTLTRLRVVGGGHDSNSLPHATLTPSLLEVAPSDVKLFNFFDTGGSTVVHFEDMLQMRTPLYSGDGTSAIELAPDCSAHFDACVRGSCDSSFQVGLNAHLQFDFKARVTGIMNVHGGTVLAEHLLVLEGAYLFPSGDRSWNNFNDNSSILLRNLALGPSTRVKVSNETMMKAASHLLDAGEFGPLFNGVGTAPTPMQRLTAADRYTFDLLSLHEDAHMEFQDVEDLTIAAKTLNIGGRGSISTTAIRKTIFLYALRMRLDPKSTLSVNEGGEDTGVTTTDPSFGASHGGLGGCESARSSAYGSIFDADVGGRSTGSRGGGVIALTVRDTLEFFGAVTANGGTGDSTKTGGASGGSVLISTTIFQGFGSLSAAGGPGTGSGGGGGGGRIAIFAKDINRFGGNYTAYGGSGGCTGGAGTVLLRTLKAGLNSDSLIAANDPQFAGASAARTQTIVSHGTQAEFKLDVFEVAGNAWVSFKEHETDRVIVDARRLTGDRTALMHVLENQTIRIEYSAAAQAKPLAVLCAIRVEEHGEVVFPTRVHMISEAFPNDYTLDVRGLLTGGGELTVATGAKVIFAPSARTASGRGGSYGVDSTEYVFVTQPGEFQFLTGLLLSEGSQTEFVSGTDTAPCKEFQQSRVCGTATVKATLVRVTTGGTLIGGDLRIVKCDSLQLGLGARITADGHGHSHGEGPGVGTSVSSASHGGYGGRISCDDCFVAQYGDYEAPDDFGSGGGDAGNSAPDGGAGGGRIYIEADLAHNDGTISASGTQGSVADPASCGSGGSVFIKVAKLLTGNGDIVANGGGGSVADAGGGGGRVAVHIEGASGFHGTFQTTGGESKHNDAKHRGGHGTAFVRELRDGYAYTSLIMGNAGSQSDVPTEIEVAGGADVTVDELHLLDGAKFHPVVNVTVSAVLVSDTSSELRVDTGAYASLEEANVEFFHPHCSFILAEDGELRLPRNVEFLGPHDKFHGLLTGVQTLVVPAETNATFGTTGFTAFRVDGAYLTPRVAPGEYVFGTMFLQKGSHTEFEGDFNHTAKLSFGTLRLAYRSTLQTAHADITADELLIESSATLDLSGLGHAADAGPGKVSGSRMPEVHSPKVAWVLAMEAAVVVGCTMG